MKSGFFVAVLGLLLTPMANAGYVSGKVQDYSVNSNSVFFFSITGTKYQKPACDTALGQVGGRFAVSTTTQFGKDIASSIISAKSSNLDVLAVGAGKCSTWGDSEDVQYITAAGNPTITVSTTSAVCADGGAPTCTCGEDGVRSHM